MKKILILLLVLSIVACAWFYFNRVSVSPASPTNGTANQFAAKLPETNSVVTAPATNTFMSSAAISKPNNALTATNLEQWKMMIDGLKLLGDNKYHQDWFMEQTNHLTGIPILFEENGKMVSYKVQFINVTAYNKNDSGKLMEVQMHSPSMNIDETRELGLQFCNMLQIDPKGFLEWCDKVGNHWVDAPLYSTETSAHLSFFILRTYDNERPWSIDFQINNP